VKYGIEEHVFSNTKVKIYSKEKTIIDCFKHRSKVGVDVALEALKNYCKGKGVNINALIEFAKISHVENTLRPYLEGILHDQS